MRSTWMSLRGKPIPEPITAARLHENAKQHVTRPLALPRVFGEISTNSLETCSCAATGLPPVQDPAAKAFSGQLAVNPPAEDQKTRLGGRALSSELGSRR